MKRILWLNSGGKDCTFVFDEFYAEHPNLEYDSFFVNTGFDFAIQTSRTVADARRLLIIEIDYKKTKQDIRALNANATQWWGLEYHHRALQYALEHEYDTILSGSTNLNIKRQHDDDDVFERLIDDIQDLLEVNSKVKLLRPVRSELHRDRTPFQGQSSI